MADAARLMKWHRELQIQLSTDLTRAFQQVEIQTAWHRAVLTFRIWWEVSSKKPFPLAPDAPCMRELVKLFQQHAPNVARVYGANLHWFLLQGIFRERGIQWPESWVI